VVDPHKYRLADRRLAVEDGTLKPPAATRNHASP
jgi:hypothetical protein